MIDRRKGFAKILEKIADANQGKPDIALWHTAGACLSLSKKIVINHIGTNAILAGLPPFARLGAGHA